MKRLCQLPSRLPLKSQRRVLSASSVEVYLRTRTKVRHDRLQVLEADSQRPGRNWGGVRVEVGRLGREDGGAAVESNLRVGKIGDRSLATGNRRRWRTRRI